MNFFRKKLPSYFLIAAVFFTALITYFLATQLSSKDAAETSASLPATDFASTGNFKIKRLSGRKFIRPLLYAERLKEAESFATIKKSINDVIDTLKAKGEINTASVYVRLFKKRGEWLSINDETKYQPGSLFKVPLLITYLRIEEKTPGILQKKIAFNQVTEESKQFKQMFMKDQIQLGHSYTVKELLRYMIVHSDNNATMLLFNNMPATEFMQTFSDLSLDSNMTKNDGMITAKDYSTFWLILYNGSYLNFDNSEYALSLLSESDFSEGMVKGIPKGVMVAHKFGEKGTQTSHCLHETGIVYANDKPYLITIMTEGSKQDVLPECLQKISSLVYEGIKAY